MDSSAADPLHSGKIDNQHKEEEKEGEEREENHQANVSM